jgi:hypothetical protein
MDVIQFRVRHPDGRVDHLVTESARVLIGTGSHCEVRLPVGAARVEHVAIQSTPAGWRAVARSFDPVPKLDGVDFNEAPVLGDCVITIDRTRVEVSPAAGVGAGDAPILKKKGKGNVRVFVYLALGLCGWMAMYSAKAHQKTAAAEPKEVPALWTAEPAKCSQNSAEPALATASAHRELALAKEERSPFHPEDGVEAVTLYENASACLRVAGRDAEADQATADAQRLRTDMVDRFRVHRLRLQRALAVEEWDLAQHESAVLLSFVPAATGPYVAWLANTRRRLQLRHGSKGEKK